MQKWALIKMKTMCIYCGKRSWSSCFATAISNDMVLNCTSCIVASVTSFTFFIWHACDHENIGRVESYWQHDKRAADELLLRHFLDALVRLAAIVHGDRFHDKQEKLAYAFDHLVRQDIIPHATSANAISTPSNGLFRHLESLDSELCQNGIDAVTLLQSLGKTIQLVGLTSVAAVQAIRQFHPRPDAYGDHDINFRLSAAQVYRYIQALAAMTSNDSSSVFDQLLATLF
eukprot:TRINITY_DN10747_c0_g1_i2.p2 TRINITY_DN10747_c0_g1~~TRINITY_DN10747_c0_g1_i2.p2  ORF type:complete len:230 (+),score=19.03 TRINITY_DN10747_c0_g1_i2:1090-1779(+)